MLPTNAPSPSSGVYLDDIQGALSLMLDLQSEYGDVVQFENCFGTSYLVSHPDLVERVFHSKYFQRQSVLKLTLGMGLLSSSGDFWRHQRRLVQHRFKKDRIPSFYRSMAEVTLALIERWHQLAQSRQKVNLAAEMRRLTLDIISLSLFSMKIGNQADEISRILATLSGELCCITAMQFNYPAKLDPDFNNRFYSSIKQIFDMASDWISDRRQLGDKPDDILSLLVTTSSTRDGNRLSDKDIQNELVTLLFAGHETTANALCWVWLLLALNPAPLQRLRSEIDEVLRDRFPVANDMEKLDYTKSVFLEALRLNPPVWIQSRAAVEDVKLGGFRIPKDATILLSAHVTHRLPEYWDDAERFDPNRFMKDLHPKHHRYAYYPFGGGGHRCLGEWFALMEGVLVIAAISQRFNIRYVDTPSLNPVLSMTNQPDPNAKVVIEDRWTEA